MKAAVSTILLLFVAASLVYLFINDRSLPEDSSTARPQGSLTRLGITWRGLMYRIALSFCESSSSDDPPTTGHQRPATSH